MVLLVGTLSRSPGLHAALHDVLSHHHEGGPDHPEPTQAHEEEAACALCLFAHGGWLNDGQTPDSVRPILGEVCGQGLRPTAPLPTFPFTSTLERGPPPVA